MDPKMLKLPVTRQEELHYYTTTRHDTLGSMVTVVDAESDLKQLPPKHSLSHHVSSFARRAWSHGRHMISTCQLAWWKSTEVLSSLCRNWWLVELISWCLAALCMVVIATILAAWNDQPLPDKFPLGLKLNAYISVLAAVAKLALAVCLEESLATQKYLWYTTPSAQHPLIDFERFELAARRPVGALRLIWRMRLK